jgi:hypothetical protein
MTPETVPMVFSARFGEVESEYDKWLMHITRKMKNKRRGLIK